MPPAATGIPSGVKKLPAHRRYAVRTVQRMAPTENRVGLGRRIAK